jgi:hypothetical protein
VCESEVGPREEAGSAGKYEPPVASAIRHTLGLIYVEHLLASSSLDGAKTTPMTFEAEETYFLCCPILFSLNWRICRQLEGSGLELVVGSQIIIFEHECITQYVT